MIIVRSLFVFFALFVAGAIPVSAKTLADIAKIDGFVPVQDVLKQNADKPYECSEYDETSKTCISVERSKFKDGTIYGYSKVLIRPDPRLEVHIATKTEAKHGMTCGNVSDAKVVLSGEKPSERLRKFFVNSLRSIDTIIGETCRAYFKQGSEYKVVTFSAATAKRVNLIPEERAIFLKTEPKLRFQEE